jgi:hypothetical protein
MGVETETVKCPLRDTKRAGPEMTTLEAHAAGTIFFSTIKSGTPITFGFFRHVSKPSAIELFLKLRAVFIVHTNDAPSKMNSFYPNYKFLTTGCGEILFQSSARTGTARSHQRSYVKLVTNSMSAHLSRNC